MAATILTTPTQRQVDALICPANEIFFGGARGGGKTYLGILDYIKQLCKLGGRAKGIAFRRSYRELTDIVDKCKELLIPLGFVQNKTDNFFEHPNGARYSLAYMVRPEDAENHQGFAYSHIFFDEIGNYKSLLGLELMKATLRGFSIPPRLVATANPGGRAHKLIKERYPIDRPMELISDSDGWTKIYIPSLFADNHYLATADPNYIKRATSGLPEYLRQAWRYGNWDISNEAGMFFSREDFQNKIVDRPPGILKIARAWDRAASEPTPQYPDPDWTVGAKIAKGADGNFYVLDVKRRRERSAKVRSLIETTARDDGKGTQVLLFQDPGQAGKGEADDMKRLLAGYLCKIEKESGAKHTRWMTFSSAVQNGIVYLVRGEWNDAFIDELVSLTDNPTDYAHDDQADAASAAFNELTKSGMAEPEVLTGF